jgi:hypothetical protein
MTSKDLMVFSIVSLICQVSHAREMVKTCSTAEILSVAVLEDPDWRTPHDFSPIITESVSKSSNTNQPAREGIMELFAFGPTLSVLDLRKVDTEVSCDGKGFTITLTIAHTGDDVLKNIPWRPKLKVTVLPHHSGVTARIFWRVRLNDGRELDRLPFDSSIKLPIEITKRLP